MLVPGTCILSYYSDLCLRGDSDDVRRIIELVIPEFAVLVAKPICSMRGSGLRRTISSCPSSLITRRVQILFRLPIGSPYIMCLLDLYQTAEQLQMVPMLMALAFDGTAETDCFLSADPKKYVASAYPRGP